MTITNATIVAGLLAVGGLGACSSELPTQSRVEPADNTGRNDTNAARPNADRAAQTGSDLELTQKIRQALVGDDALSINAKNAKIVVENGTATLVGPVATLDEKHRVVDAASAAGAIRVVDKLDVISEPTTR